MPPAGTPLCGAQNKQGVPCRMAAMANGRCMHHGGKTPRGILAPRFEHGRYSKHLPAKLADKYEAARTNPRLLSLREEIATLEARELALMEGVEEEASRGRWQALKQALAAYNIAEKTGNTRAMAAQFEQLRVLIEAGTDAAAVWEEIEELWRTRAKLQETEINTLKTMQAMVSVEQLMIYMSAVTDAVTSTVQKHAPEEASKQILGDLLVEFRRLSNLTAR